MVNTITELRETLQPVLDLNYALDMAVKGCWTDVDNLEEHGGIILFNPTEGTYMFKLLTNKNAGTKVGPYLWTADQFEYAKEVIPMFRKGWQQYASFHTHPQFDAIPSGVDLRDLFPGFAVNYIFSPKESLIREFTWDKAEVIFKHTNTINLETNE